MSENKRAKKLGVYESTDAAEMTPQMKVFNSGYLMRDIVKWTNSRSDFHAVRQVVPGGVNVQWYSDPEFRQETRHMFKSKYAPDPVITEYFNSRGRKEIKIAYADPIDDAHVLRTESIEDSGRINYVLDIDDLIVREYDLQGREIAQYSKNYSWRKGSITESVDEDERENHPYNAQIWSHILKSHE